MKMSSPPEESPDDFQLDRTQFSVVDLADPDDAPAYWRSRPVGERLRALELLRRTMWGSRATERIQMVFEVVHVEWR